MRSLAISFLILRAVLLAGCQPVDDPRATRWVADLQQSAQVLSMDYESRQGPVSGQGTLSSLFDVGDPAILTYTGEQRGDTVDIAFARPAGDGFRFLGAFRSGGSVIVGVLNGVEFNAVPATFRRP